MKYFYFFTLLLLISFPSCDKEHHNSFDDPDPPEEEMYFPSANHDEWATSDPDSLGWDGEKLEELVDYLDQKNTKGFIILKDGKIVVEEYFDDHDIHSNWPWYSAAKSLTSTMVGIASDEGLLDLNDKSSMYLGDHWSSLTKDKEDLITVKNHITMTTGLQNPIGNFLEWTCTIPACFNYLADAGTRWSYHQGAFTLTQDIITNATGINFKTYGKQMIQDKIGMNGSWSELIGVRIFSSTTRSMARFGLLALNNGVWDDQVIYSSAYHNDMISTSQYMNKAYGYLWWLNGKSSFMATADQTTYNGFLLPDGPPDIYAALGAQDQKIYVVPSQDLVVVRCGDPAGNTEFASTSFDNELWRLISEILP